MASGLTTQQAFTQVQSDITYLADIPKSTLSANSTVASGVLAANTTSTLTISSHTTDPQGEITVSGNNIQLPAGVFSYVTNITLGTPTNFLTWNESFGLTINTTAAGISGTTYRTLWTGGGSNTTLATSGTSNVLFDLSGAIPWCESGLIFGPATVNLSMANNTNEAFNSTTNWNISFTRIA